MTLFERKKTNHVLIMNIFMRSKYINLDNTGIISINTVKLLKDIYVLETIKIYNSNGSVGDDTWYRMT